MSGCCTFFKVAGREYYVNTVSLVDHAGRLVLDDTGAVYDIDLDNSQLPIQVGPMTKFEYNFGSTTVQVASTFGCAIAYRVVPLGEY